MSFKIDKLKILLHNKIFLYKTINMLLIIYISRIRVVLQNSYRIPVSEQQIAPICSMTDTCRFYYSYFIFRSRNTFINDDRDITRGQYYRLHLSK